MYRLNLAFLDSICWNKKLLAEHSDWFNLGQRCVGVSLTFLGLRFYQIHLHLHHLMLDIRYALPFMLALRSTAVKATAGVVLLLNLQITLDLFELL